MNGHYWEVTKGGRALTESADLSSYFYMVHDKQTNEERSWRSFNSTNLSPRAEINRKRRNFGGAFRSLFKNVPTTTTTSAAFVQSKSKRAGGKRRVEGGGQILEPIFGVVKFPFPGLFAQTSPPLLCSFPLQQKLSRHKKAHNNSRKRRRRAWGDKQMGKEGNII